jgi:hypothetical protein
MNIKTLITSFAIVAATSTVALADRVASFNASASWSYSPTAFVRDHRIVASGPVYSARHPDCRLVINNTRIYPQYSEYIGALGTMGRGYGMVALSEPTRIDNGREDFNVRRGGFDALQLRGIAGTSFIREVRVEFMDTSGQVIPVKGWLENGASINLDIKGSNRQVKRILVYGTTSVNSSYQLFAW